MTDVNKESISLKYNSSDELNSRDVIKVFSGDCCVTNEPNKMMVTVLGSCIAACIRDPEVRVGGMNHFLLPDSSNSEGTSLRYGSYSMEKLINDILKMGGKKERLEIKVFGGGNVIESSSKIGDKNVKFIREYLSNEGLRINEEDLGGKSPRRIHYFPDSGKVMMRKVRGENEVEEVKQEENIYRKTITDEASHENDSSANVEFF